MSGSDSLTCLCGRQMMFKAKQSTKPSLPVPNRVLLCSATALAAATSCVTHSATPSVQFPSDKTTVYPFYHLCLVVSQA